jgi:hypothetical protein
MGCRVIIEFFCLQQTIRIIKEVDIYAGGSHSTAVVMEGE